LHQLLLDGMFVALVAHFLVTGHVVPPALIDLLRHDPQVVVVTPLDSHSAPDTAPATNDSADDTPGT
jgi:hypothetical protein